MQRTLFHLAIPSHDLNEAENFYLKLGCHLARRYKDHLNFNFFGHQLVCHLNHDPIDASPQMYPRHFGMVFESKTEFEQVYQLCKERKLPFFKDKFERFSGKTEAHASFFIRDPSNNLLEFKYYENPRMMY